MTFSTKNNNNKTLKRFHWETNSESEEYDIYDIIFQDFQDSLSWKHKLTLLLQIYLHS